MKKKLNKKFSPPILFSVLILFMVWSTFLISGQYKDIKNGNKNVKPSEAIFDNLPQIEEFSLNKAKYLPGDEMVIKVKTKKANSVQASIENEKGLNKVNFSLASHQEEFIVWEGKWIVSDSLDGKKYSLKISAGNEYGVVEKSAYWVDPNPGHNLSSVSVDQDLDMGTFGISLGGVMRSSWPKADIPAGIIAMWYGSVSSIPSGWKLCDGSGGTPDLRARFVRGAPAGSDPGATGGEDEHTLTINEMPSHNHTVGNQSFTSRTTYGNRTAGPISGATGFTGGGQPHNNMPAYYEVAFICKM